MSAQPQMDIFEAIAAKDSAIDQVVANSDASYRNKLLAAIQVLAAHPVAFCADDVRAMAGDPPAGTHPNVAGAVVNHAAKAGLIRTVGFTRSARIAGHANTVRLWRGGADRSD